MRTFLAVLAAWLLSATLASAQMMGISGGPFTVSSSYTGPGDIVSGAKAFWGLQAYNAAYATGSNDAVNYRRASDGTTQDGVILSNGSFDMATALTFAGTDATCTGLTTGASTTIAFTGCSSTPHAGSTLFGVGLVLPSYIVSCGAFTSGAGSCTLNAAQNLSSHTFTMTYGLYVTEWYDQTGNGFNLLQPTTASQPQLMPGCGPGGGYCILSTSSSINLAASGSITPATGALSISLVANVVGFVSAGPVVRENGSSTPNRVNVGPSGTAWNATGGSSGSVAYTASMNAWHASQNVINGALSVANLDGAETTGTATGSTAAGAPNMFPQGSGSLVEEVTELGIWDNVTFSGTQRTNVCKNEQARYGSTNFGAQC